MQRGGGLTPDQVWTKYGDKLIAKLQTDQSYKSDLTHLPVDFIAADPTPRATYVEWIVLSYIRGGIRLYEDLLSRVKPALIDYQKISGRLQRGLPGQPWTNETDINTFCGIIGCKAGKRDKFGLEDLLDKYRHLLDEQTVSNAKPATKSKAIFDGDEIKVYAPKTTEEACHYGRGTRWCTSATRGPNMFNKYFKRGPLFIIVPKNPKYVGEKYQVHQATKQFMNEKDEPLARSRLIKTYPELKLVEELRWFTVLWGLIYDTDRIRLYRFKDADDALPFDLPRWADYGIITRTSVYGLKYNFAVDELHLHGIDSIDELLTNIPELLDDDISMANWRSDDIDLLLLLIAHNLHPDILDRTLIVYALFASMNAARDDVTSKFIVVHDIIGIIDELIDHIISEGESPGVYIRTLSRLGFELAPHQLQLSKGAPRYYDEEDEED